MDRQWIYGIIGALVTAGAVSFLTWVIVTSDAGLDAAETARIEAVIEANQVISRDEVVEIKEEQATQGATLKASLEVQKQLLEAVLND